MEADFPGEADMTSLAAPAGERNVERHPATPPMRSAADCREWIEANFPLLRHLVRLVCRTGGVRPCEEADFMGAVFVKLVDRDYAVLRQFDGRSSIRTFLYTVMRRHLLDWRDAKWGKWRPSARARQMGDAAVHLERLTLRDGFPVCDAVRILATQPQWGLSSSDLRGLHAQLPRRAAHRPQEVPLDPDVRSAPDRADADVERRDLRCEARKAGADLTAVLAALNDDDRRLLRMRFQDDMSVADIALAIGCDPKRLYRRFGAVLRRLRARLEAHNLTRSNVRPLLGHPEVTLTALISRGAVEPPGSRPPHRSPARACVPTP